MSRDLKDVLIATIPSIIPGFMVGIVILLNKNDINRVSAEIATLRTEVRSDMTGLRTEMGAMRNQFHADIITLVNISNDLDKRVSRLEDKG